MLQQDSTQLSSQLRRYARLNTGHFFGGGGGGIYRGGQNIFHSCIFKRIRASYSAIRKFIATTVYDRFMVYATLKRMRYLYNARASDL